MMGVLAISCFCTVRLKLIRMWSENILFNSVGDVGKVSSCLVYDLVKSIIMYMRSEVNYLFNVFDCKKFNHADGV